MHMPRAFEMGTRLGTLESLDTVKIALLRCTRGGWVRVHYRNISHTPSAATPPHKRKLKSKQQRKMRHMAAGSSDCTEEYS
jgi:hypothetical protein